MFRTRRKNRYSAFWNQEKDGAQASLSVRSFHEELSLDGGKEDTFHFSFFLSGAAEFKQRSLLKSITVYKARKKWRPFDSFM